MERPTSPTPNDPSVGRPTTSSFYFLFLLTSFILLSSQGSGSLDLTELKYRSFLQQRVAERDELTYGNWTKAALDGETGRSGGPEIQHMSYDLIGGEGIFWHNLTGFLKGDWQPREMNWQNLGLSETWNETVRNPDWKDEPKDPENLVKPDKEKTISEVDEIKDLSASTEQFISKTFNITTFRGAHDWSRGGKLNFNIREVGRVDLLNQSVLSPELPPETFYNLRGSLDILLSETTLSYSVEGLHQLSTGTFLFLTSPDPRSILGFLPAFWDNQTITEAAGAIKTGYDYRIQKLERMIENKQWPEQEEEEDLVIKCGWAGWGKLRTLNKDVSDHMVNTVEMERHEPSGLRIPQLGNPTLDVIMYSKECGMVVQSTELGLQSLTFDIFWEKGLHYAVLMGVISLIQVILLVRQMEQRSSPANLTKISHLTILVQAVIDAYSLAMHLTLSVVTDNRSTVAFLIPSFFSGLSSMVFGLRYAAHIRITVPPTPSTPSFQEEALPSATGLPSPVTQPRHNDDSITMRDVSKFFIVLTPIISIVGFITIWGFVPFFAALMYSFWIPQIIHNSQGGQRRMGLKKEFVIGITLCRLFLPVYFWGCPQNILFNDTSPSILLLVFYQALQLTVLLLQDSIHPRFFLPSWWRETSYDYHTLSAVGEKSEVLETECGVCFDMVDLHPSEHKRYMVTPCRHIFHTKCLTTWMGVRMTCPMCKSTLPNYWSLIDG